jgi:hypothetical protein
MLEGTIASLQDLPRGNESDDIAKILSELEEKAEEDYKVKNNAAVEIDGFMRCLERRRRRQIHEGT